MHKDDGHKEESPNGNKKTRQNMDPKETSQEKELKHKNDGLNEESPKGLTEEEPKDNDDGHKEEDPKPERALLWLLKKVRTLSQGPRGTGCLKVCSRSRINLRARAWWSRRSLRAINRRRVLT